MNFICSLECNKRDFCSAWCIVESECRLTNFIISPQDGPEDSDHVTCYSNRRPGNHIVKATTTSSNTDNFRNPSVLTRGIYNFDRTTTTASLNPDPNPYMLFEFPSEVSIKTLSFLNGINAATVPSDQTEIRLGSSMPGGPTDFSKLELLRTFDQNLQPNEWVTYTVDPPKKAKFLALLETDGTRLALKFIEVFG